MVIETPRSDTPPGSRDGRIFRRLRAMTPQYRCPRRAPGPPSAPASRSLLLPDRRRSPTPSSRPTPPDDAVTVEGSPAEISATFSETLATGRLQPVRCATRQGPSSRPAVSTRPTRRGWSSTRSPSWPRGRTRSSGPRPPTTATSSAGPGRSPSPPPRRRRRRRPRPRARPRPHPATATAAPSPTPDRRRRRRRVAPSPSGDGGSSAGDTNDVILPIIVALALVAIVGGFLLTRRGRATPPPA